MDHDKTLRDRMLEPGYKPDIQDVAEMIEQELIVKLPKAVRCKCGFWVAYTEDRCIGCNTPRGEITGVMFDSEQVKRMIQGALVNERNRVIEEYGLIAESHTEWISFVQNVYPEYFNSRYEFVVDRGWQLRAVC